MAGYETGRWLVDYLDSHDSADDLSWVRFETIYDNTASLDTSDRYVTTWDVMNVTNGSIDSTWTEADLDFVQARISAISGSWQPYMSSFCSVIEDRAYARGFNGYGTAKPFADSGPPLKTWPRVVPGLATTQGVPQAALSVTEEVARRANWGRFYLPCMALPNASNGRPTQVMVDAIAQRVHDTYDELMTNEYFPVVPVTQIDKTTTRGLYTVTGVRVDDVGDVIRRRRYANPTYRKILPITP